jgi:hypothetical protein
MLSVGQEVKTEIPANLAPARLFPNPVALATFAEGSIE